MCRLRNSDVLVKYLPAPRGQRPLSRKEIVITSHVFLLIFSFRGSKALQDWSVGWARERGTKSSYWTGTVKSPAFWACTRFGADSLPHWFSVGSPESPLPGLLEHCSPRAGVTPVVPEPPVALFNCRLSQFNCRFCK